ncbi:hypothetical protein F0562_023628 [Nyssa sinensis]|uniref:Retrovirus-related Pol polyprotein from transposon TNT 1-94-like beta-barrel domain-containing protein n=1 Tax=Nyssa sinensis TaxID=561372 RepID=A0A5J5BHV4_9ASTE|nr:hypothetical protein F0562_023628 [Nyssa sinensis]
MAAHRFMVASLLLCCFLHSCYGVTFSSLQRTLVVTASPTPGQVVKAGEDQITVTWSFNQTFPGTDSAYKTIKVMLCYAPISQVDRAWRNTVDNLAKDKTCQFQIVAKPYSPSNNSFTWTIEKDIPQATYFVRSYAYNSDSSEAAYETIVTSNSAAQSNPAFLKWRRTDRLVKGWLTATLSEEVLGIVVGLGTAAEVWNALVHAFARASSARSLALKQRLTSITRGTDNLSTYLRRFKTICDELAAIGKPVSDQKKSWWLLNGLGKDFEIFTATMLRPPVPSYSEVVTQLESYAERHNINSPAQPPVVFYGQKTYKNRKGQGQSASFNSKGRGFTQGNQSAHKTSNSFGQSSGSHQSRGNKKDDGPTCQICNKKYHTAIECFERFNHSFTTDNLPQAFSAVQVGDTEDFPWHLDTGATDHMTASTGNLQSVTPYTKSDGVMVGNGHILPITHIGTATLSSGSSSIKLNDVLVVPDIQKDLLSVSKLTSDYPLIFEFNGPGFVLKDRISKQIIAKGWKRKGLYTFEGSQDHSTSPTALFSSRHVVFDESLLPYSKPTALYGEPPVEGEFCIFEEHADILSPSAFASPSNMSHSPTMPPSQPAPASDMRHEVSQHDATPVLCPDTSHATATLVSPHDNSQPDSLSREQLQHTMITRAKSGVRKPNPKAFTVLLAFL